MSAESPASHFYPDDPELDCTDAAHPAWWRGHEHGAASVVQAINELLDGKPHTGVFGFPPLEALAQRILALRSVSTPSASEARDA